MSAKTKTLIPIVKKYFENDPVSAAKNLENLPKEQAKDLIEDISPELASIIFKYLQPHFAAQLLLELNTEYFEKVVSGMEPSFGAAIFLTIPQEEQEIFINKLEPKLKKEIYEHLQYPEDSVGAVMSINYLVFKSNQKVKDVINKIRQNVKRKVPIFLSTIYIVDEKQSLIGVANTRDLILVEGEKTVDSITNKDPYKASPFDSAEVVAGNLAKLKYLSAPIVDSENRLLGHVHADKLIKEAQEEAATDIQTMFGVAHEEKVFSPILTSLKSRLPWLHVNLLTAFLAASVVAFFEDIIAKITVLAVFLPVIAGQGGNAGAQSLAIVMRGLVMREIPPSKQKSLVIKEVILGLLNGIIVGIVTALVAYFWYKNIYLGLVVGLAMIINLLIAGLAGSSTPLLMKKLGLDPAQCSNIVLTTITDVLGFLVFLSIAILFQNKLI